LLQDFNAVDFYGVACRKCILLARQKKYFSPSHRLKDVRGFKSTFANKGCILVGRFGG